MAELNEQYEYMKMSLSQPNKLLDELDSYGLDGWIVCGMRFYVPRTAHEYVDVYLMRRIEEPRKHVGVRNVDDYE